MKNLRKDYKVKMKKTFLLAAGLLCGASLLGCATFTHDPVPPEQGLVITTQSEVRPDVLGEAIQSLPPEIVPDSVEQSLGASPTNPIVITEKGNLKAPPPEPKFIPVENVDLTTSEGWIETLTNPSIIGSLAGGLGGAAPYLVGVEALLTVFSKRKRQHYVAAAKQAAHLDLAETAKAVVKALGAAHTDTPVDAPKPEAGC